MVAGVTHTAGVYYGAAPDGTGEERLLGGYGSSYVLFFGCLLEAGSKGVAW